MTRKTVLFLLGVALGFASSEAVAQNPGSFDRPIVVGITQADVTKSCDDRRLVAVNMTDGSVCVCKAGSWVCATTGQLNLSGSGSAGQITIWDSSTVLGGDTKLSFDRTNGVLETQAINLNKGASPLYRYIEFGSTGGNPGAPAAGGARLYFDASGFYRRDATGGRLMLDTTNLTGHISVNASGQATIADDAVTIPKLYIDNSGAAGNCLKQSSTPNVFTWGTCGIGYANIYDESTQLPQQDTLRFTGDGVSCVNNVAGARTDCTITGGGGGGGSADSLTGNDSVTINPDLDGNGTGVINITSPTHTSGFKISQFDIDGDGTPNLEIYNATPRYGTGGSNKATTLRVQADGDCAANDASCRSGFEFTAGDQVWSIQGAWHGATTPFQRYERASLDVDLDGDVDVADQNLFWHQPVISSTPGSGALAWYWYNNSGNGSLSPNLTFRPNDSSCVSAYPSDPAKWGGINFNGTIRCFADLVSAKVDSTNSASMTFTGDKFVKFQNTAIPYSVEFTGGKVRAGHGFYFDYINSQTAANFPKGSMTFDYWGDIEADNTADAVITGLVTGSNESDYSASGGWAIGMYNASDPFDYAGGGMSTFVTKSRAFFNGWDDLDGDNTRDSNEVGKLELPGRLILTGDGEAGAVQFDADGSSKLNVFAKVVSTNLLFVIDLDKSNTLTDADVCLMEGGLDEDCDGTLDPGPDAGDWALGVDSAQDGVSPEIKAESGYIGISPDGDGAYDVKIFPGTIALDAANRSRILFDMTNEAAALTYKYCVGSGDIALMYDANNNGSYNAGDDYCWGVGGYDYNCNCDPDPFPTGSGAANRVAFWSDIGVLTHDVGFNYDPTTDTLQVGTIETTGAADGSRYLELEDNSSVEPDAPGSGPPSITRLYSYDGEFYKKDPGDGASEKLILNSGNLSGDVQASVAGAATIQDNAVQESDLDITNAGSTNDCLKKSATSDKFDWGSCSTGGGYATVQDEGTPLTQRTTMNFTGAGISCSDTASVTTCTVAGGSGGNAFGKVSVSGQDDVDADGTSDQLTLVAGSNITLTTSAAGDSVTIAATGGGSGDEVTVDGTAITSPVNFQTGTGDIDFQISGSNVQGVVQGLRTTPIASTAPSNGQVLKYNGSEWAPAADATGGASADPWTEVTTFEDYLRSSAPAGSATECIGAGISDGSGSGATISSSATLDHTNAGVNMVGACYLALGGNTNGFGVSLGIAGFAGKDLDQDAMAFAKMRSYRTRWNSSGSNWGSTTNRNVMYIVGGYKLGAVSANAADDIPQRGAYFICAPYMDWDDDNTAGDGAEDANWMFMVSNDTDGTADSSDLCYQDGGGSICTQDPDITVYNTGVVCNGSGRNDKTYQMLITYTGGGGDDLSAYLDDNNDTSTWTWSQTNIETDIPTGGYVAGWGHIQIAADSGTIAALNTSVDWQYYNGTR